MVKCERCGKREGDFCDIGQKDMFGEPVEICICDKCIEKLQEEYLAKYGT